jgi:hypothetical protein
MRRPDFARRAIAAGLWLALLPGCSRAKPPESASPAPVAAATASSEPEAEALVRKLEQTLLASANLRLEAKVELIGAVELTLSGKLLLKPENVASAEFTGTREGEPLALFLTSDGKIAKGGPRKHSFEEGAPPALRRNMLVAFAHKGLTPAIMDLMAGSVPNSGEQGAADRSRLAKLSLGNRVTIAKQEVQAVNFDMLMDDQLAGQGTLWIGADSGLPVLRVLYVRRPRELVVVERYQVLQLDAGS